MTTQTTTDAQARATTKICPECGAAMPVIDGYQTWCDRCNYDILAPPAEEPIDAFERYRERLGKRFGDGLLAEMLAQAQPRPGLSLGNIVAFALSAIVLTIPLIVTGLSLSLLKTQFEKGNSFSIICLGLPTLIFSGLLLWQARPRLGSAPKDVVTREQAPTLYRLVDDVAALMRTKPVAAISIAPGFNASYGRYGLRRNVHLTFGLPIVYATSPQELVTVVAHELAHGINGDINRDMLLVSALNTAHSLHEAVTPDELGSGGLYGVLSRLLLLPVRLLLRLTFETLLLLTFRNSQRAEYYADLLAARVAGTAASVRMLRKVGLKVKFGLIATTTWSRLKLYKDENVYQKFREHVATLPEREVERFARIQSRTHSSLDAAHPPSEHRVRYLLAHPVESPAFTLSQADHDAIRRELMPFEKQMQDQMMGA
jgi:Zn-dependent protease with chaperone function